MADQLIDNRASSAAREFAWGSLQRTVATVVPIMPSLKKSMLGRVMLTRLGPRKPNGNLAANRLLLYPKEYLKHMLRHERTRICTCSDSGTRPEWTDVAVYGLNSKTVPALYRPPFSVVP